MSILSMNTGEMVVGANRLREPLYRAIPTPAASASVKPRIADVLLLAGGVRANAFRSRLGRSVLDLPIGGGRRLMDLWHDEVSGLGRHFGGQQIRVRVQIDGATPSPSLRGDRFREVETAVERDVQSFRGTGGVLRDACADLPADRYVLVCHAFQVLCQPLVTLVERLYESAGDVSFSMEPCGGAGGVFLVRGNCLSAIPSIGFVDLKEQAIPLIAKRHRVRVVTSVRPTSMPIWSASGYIAALLHLQERQGGDRTRPFSIVEAGAQVAASARVHDSVVLAGGRVGAGAILAGSVVGSAGVVRPGQRVVHELITAGR